MSISHIPTLVVTTWLTPNIVLPDRPCRENQQSTHYCFKRARQRKALSESNLQVLLERELSILSGKEQKYPFCPSQLIATNFEHFILPLCSHNSRQANSTPRRTPQCKYIQIMKLKTLYKRKPSGNLVMQSLRITAITVVLPLHWKGQTIPQEFSDAQHRSHSCSHWGTRNELLASVLPPWSIGQKATH